MRMTPHAPSLRFAACLLTAALAAGGCSDDPDPTGDTDTGGNDVGNDASEDTGGDMGEDVEVGGDTAEDGGADAPDVPTEVTVSEYFVTENTRNVLAAIATLETEPATTAVITVTGPERTFTIEWPEEPATEYEVPILGLRPETEYTFDVRVRAADGTEATAGNETWETAELPTDFPPMNVLTATDGVSPGFTMFSANRWNPSLDQNYGYIVIMDSEGVPVWYYRAGVPVGDANRLANGNIVYVAGVNAAYEVDMTGEDLNFFFPRDLGTESFHHAVLGAPEDDTLFIVGTERREVSGYPTEGEETATYNVIGDVILHFDRERNRLGRWTVFDWYDPTDVPQDLEHVYWESFNDPFWDFLYDGNTKDWSHVNNVHFDPRDPNMMIVSLRHLDAIAKVDLAENELIWTFGPNGDFTMVGDGEWQYHQHAPQLLADGTMIVYDNGNGRNAEPNGENSYSRVVHYALDEEEMTAEQLWEYRGDEQYFARFVGDVDFVDNGNVLITDGGILSDPTIPETSPDGGRFGRLVEVTYEEEPEVVLEVEIRDPDGDASVGYNLFRSIRFADLYPE
jgi:arylsulfate sulfotransferase